jgi:arginine/lysine/ornithine decarboxylase
MTGNGATIASCAGGKPDGTGIPASLVDFHRAYEANVPLAEALSEVYAAFPARYAGAGLRDVADQMHEFLSGYDTAQMQQAISAELPVPVLTPASAFAALVQGRTEQVSLSDLEGRISAVTCLLYRPGIPVVVPGERFDARMRPIVDYLRLFERWEERFPGFENEVQGGTEYPRRADLRPCPERPVPGDSGSKAWEGATGARNGRGGRR